jgi:hypothetical protein
MAATKIRSNVINYRKGFVEFTPLIHDGCINIETWHVHPDIDISSLDIGDGRFPDGGVIANTELELSIEAAEQMIEALQSGISEVRASRSR